MIHRGPQPPLHPVPPNRSPQLAPHHEPEPRPHPVSPPENMRHDRRCGEPFSISQDLPDLPTRTEPARASTQRASTAPSSAAEPRRRARHASSSGLGTHGSSYDGACWAGRYVSPEALLANVGRKRSSGPQVGPIISSELPRTRRRALPDNNFATLRRVPCLAIIAEPARRPNPARAPFPLPSGGVAPRSCFLVPEGGSSGARADHFPQLWTALWTTSKSARHAGSARLFHPHRAPASPLRHRPSCG